MSGAAPEHWPTVHLTKEEAAEALRDAAWEEQPSEEELGARVAELEDAIRELLDSTSAILGAHHRQRLTALLTPPPRRKTVHSFLGLIGADHDLDAALARVAEADEVAWVTSMTHHDLAVRIGDRVYYYHVPRPERR